VIVRTEGITELVGDLLLQCVGGVPTPAGKPIPGSNITYTLNTNITSRLLGGGFIDALLLIDEPYPVNPAVNQNPPPSQVPTPPLAPTQNVCAPNSQPAPGLCNYELGTFNGILPGLPGSAPSPYTNQANVFIANQTAANQVSWLGIPIDAPGTAFVRQIRMTNVRANACQLGLSSTLIPTQIVAFISLNGSQQITINNPQQTVAFIQLGLIVAGQNTGLQQCNNLNVGGGGIGGNFFGGSLVGIAVTNVNLKEGFAASFKRRQVPVNGTVSIPLGGVQEGTQDVPGFSYNTESGFTPVGTNQTAFNIGALGQANSATRFLLRFNNVGVGVRLILPIVVPLTTNNGTTPGTPQPPSSVAGWTGGFLQLVAATDGSGNVGAGGFATGSGPIFSNSSFFFSSGPFKGLGAVAPFNVGQEITGVGGSFSAVYEVVNADPNAPEQANIPVGVAFISNTAQNIPTPGQSTVNASFAPLSTVGTADGSANIPRFCDNSTARNTFHIDVCSCNLLFPFISNQAGFDTGIAIANTTLDPYGTTPQNGTIKLFYFGNTPGNGAAPPAQTSQTVPGGSELIFTLSGGGNFGIDARGAGFQGYMFAIANFQFCHGFAFINDTHSSLSEGYLAIQIDIYGGTGLNRTGVVGEVQGH